MEAEAAWLAPGAQEPVRGSSLPSLTHGLWDWGSGCQVVAVAVAAAVVWVRGRLGQSIGAEGRCGVAR